MRGSEKNWDTLNFAARGGALVHLVYPVFLVYLVFLVCVVRRTRETRQTRAPDRLPLNPPRLHLL